jgi:hypothetical protein
MAPFGARTHRVSNIGASRCYAAHASPEDPLPRVAKGEFVDRYYWSPLRRSGRLPNGVKTEL